MLRFRLGPFPVAIELSFLLFAVLLGASGRGDDWLRLLLWVVIVTVSVIVHELGHAFVGLALGGRPEIRLQGLGGVTFPNLTKRPAAWQDLLLAAAGPAAGLSLWAAAHGAQLLLDPRRGDPSAEIIYIFKYTSVVWAVLNLIPVVPLDGGHILESVLRWIRGKPAPALASWISAVVAAGLGVLCIVLRQWFLVVLFGLFLFQNIARARAFSGGGGPKEPEPAAPPPLDPFARADVDDELQKARAALARDDVEEALAAAARLEARPDDYRQAAGLRIRAGVELATHDNEAAGLHAGRSYALFATPDAAVVAARANLRTGAKDRAQNWVRRALEAGASAAAVKADPELGPLVSEEVA